MKGDNPDTAYIDAAILFELMSTYCLDKRYVSTACVPEVFQTMKPLVYEDAKLLDNW